MIYDELIAHFHVLIGAASWILAGRALRTRPRRGVVRLKRQAVAGGEYRADPDGRAGAGPRLRLL